MHLEQHAEEREGGGAGGGLLEIIGGIYASAKNNGAKKVTGRYKVHKHCSHAGKKKQLSATADAHVMRLSCGAVPARRSGAKRARLQIASKKRA